MRYLTKEWYIACQADPMTPEVQKQTSELDHEAVILQEPDPLTAAAWTHSCPGRFFMQIRSRRR